MTNFRDLSNGDTFDFVDDGSYTNSFFKRCEKLSSRKYKDEDGFEYTVGSTSVPVYHVKRGQ